MLLLLLISSGDGKMCDGKMRDDDSGSIVNSFCNNKNPYLLFHRMILVGTLHIEYIVLSNI